MTYEVVVTAAAKLNLRSAYLWAAERAPDTAALWLQRFEIELQRWQTFPNVFNSRRKMPSSNPRFAN